MAVPLAPATASSSLCGRRWPTTPRYDGPKNCAAPVNPSASPLGKVDQFNSELLFKIRFTEGSDGAEIAFPIITCLQSGRFDVRRADVHHKFGDPRRRSLGDASNHRFGHLPARGETVEGLRI